jgi:hypothetical protein
LLRNKSLWVSGFKAMLFDSFSVILSRQFTTCLYVPSRWETNSRTNQKINNIEMDFFNCFSFVSSVSVWNRISHCWPIHLILEILTLSPCSSLFICRIQCQLLWRVKRSAPDEWEDRCVDGVAWSIPLCVVWTSSFKFSISRSDLSKAFWKCDGPKLQLSFTLVTSSIISVGFRNWAPHSARTFERFDYAVETLFFNGRINVLCNRHFAGWMNKKTKQQLNNGCKIQTWFSGHLLQLSVWAFNRASWFLSVWVT